MNTLNFIGIMILTVIVTIAILCIIGLAIATYVPDSWFIKIYGPKSKIFDGKLEPIYKLIFDGYDNYQIEKYILGWESFFFCLIWPTYIYSWQYIKYRSISIGGENDVRLMNVAIENDKISFRDYAKARFDIIELQEKLKKEESNKIENFMNSFNKEFKDNYE